MRIIVKDITPVEPEGERESLGKVATGTLHWTPKGWEVGGTVILSGKGLKKIPFLFHRVEGCFDVSKNGLTDLAGSPRTVGGDFWANSNHLTSLIGGPETVGGSCYLSYNRLGSTRGIPRKIGRNLYLNRNPYLTSLDGFPDEVGEDLILWGTPVRQRVQWIPGVRGTIDWGGHP